MTTILTKIMEHKYEGNLCFMNPLGLMGAEKLINVKSNKVEADNPVTHTSLIRF